MQSDFWSSMLYYFYMYFFFSAIAIAQSRFKELSQALDVVGLIALYVFIGLRLEVGGDWWGYNNLLQNCAVGMYHGAAEPFFVLLMKLSLVFPVEYQYTVLNSLMAILLLLGLFLIIKKYARKLFTFSQLIWVIFPIFIFLFGTGYLRQGIACLFLIPIIFSLKDKKIAQAFILTLLSIAFHKSAAVYLLLVFFAYLKNKDINYLNFFTWTSWQKLIFLMTLIGLSSCILIWAKPYINNSMRSYGVMIRLAYLCLLLTPVIIVDFKKLKKVVGDSYFWMFCLFCGLFIFLFSTIADRLLLYLFLPSAWIALTYLSEEKLKHSLSKFYIFGFFLLNTAYLFFWLKYSYWGVLRWVPYKNILM